MQVRILGSAAGGGVPQWNCRCPNCTAARGGSPDVRPRTQSSVAVSADGRAWFLLNVSPDVRQQLLAYPELGPPEGQQRGTAVAGCVLTDAELDHTAGLLHLREQSVCRIFCTPLVRRWLNHYLPVETVLAHFGAPAWQDLPLDRPVCLPLADGSPSGLNVRPFVLSGHVPRFVREELTATAGSVIGLVIRDEHTGGTLVYAPCAAANGKCPDADCILFDGTFWSDDEPQRCGISNRTARAMGHVPVSGQAGSLAWLASLSARHRVYVHINNTNPMLNERGPEHRAVTDAGVRVGMDGDYFEL